MSIVTRGTFPHSLKTIIKEWVNLEYKNAANLYKDIFTIMDSKEAYEDFVGYFGTSLAVKKSEGKSVSYDSIGEGHKNRATHDTFSIGLICTSESIEDNKYSQLIAAKSKSLGISMSQTKDTFHANILNRGTNASYTFGDGVTFYNSAHPLSKSTGTFSNTSTAAALSEATLEQACIDIANWTDEAGMHAVIKPQCLVIPPALKFIAMRILKSSLQNDTANNALNALSASGAFPKGIKENVFLDSTTQWQVLTDVKGLVSLDRTGLVYSEDNDFDTDDIKMKVKERYSATVSDPRAAYGNAGA